MRQHRWHRYPDDAVLSEGERAIEGPRSVGDVAGPAPPTHLRDGAAAVGNSGFTRLVNDGGAVLADGRVHPHLARAIAAHRGGGRALDPDTRRRHAHAMGAPLDDVRIHDDSDAATLARSVGAQAFTVGSDVFFDGSEARPGTVEGDSLLAHELVHVTQSRGAASAGPLRLAPPDGPMERAAEHPGRGGGEAVVTPASPLLHRRPRGLPPSGQRAMTFEDTVITGRVSVLDPSAGGSAVAEITNLIGDLRVRLQTTQTNMLAAVNMFALDQAFASTDEGEAKFDAVFLSYAGKTLLKEAFGLLGEKGPIPGVGKIYEMTAGLLEKLSEEDERAAKARGSRAVAQFVGDYIDTVTREFGARLDAIPALRESLAQEYNTLAAATPELSTPTAPAGGPPGAAPAVAGEAAAFLNHLKTAVASVKAPSTVHCLQTIAEAWVGGSEGTLMSRGGGDMYMNGRIVINMGVSKDGDTYRITDQPRATLKAPRADHVIDSLKRILQGGKSINDLNILKVLQVDVEDEVWGFNHHYMVRMRYRDPGTVEDLSTIPSPVQDDAVAAAPAVQKRVRELIKLDDVRPAGLKAEEEGRPV